MSHLELFSKHKKKRNHSILTEAPEKLFKNASEHHKYNSFYRLQKPTQLSGAQNSKVLPKNILYDKQSLYLEVLSLKVELNQVMDENIKLKTKMINLQKQLESINKRSTIEDNSKFLINLNKKDKGQIKNNDGINENVKKKLKDLKKEVDLLKIENLTLRKNGKISKVKQLQIQNAMIIQQNQKLSDNIVSLKEKLQNCHALQQKNKVLQREKSALSREIHRLEQQISTMKFYIKTIQLDRKYQVSSLHNREKAQESYTFRKKQNLNGAKHLQQLRKEFLQKKEVSIRSRKVIKLNHNIQPIRKQPIKMQQRQNGEDQILQKQTNLVSVTEHKSDHQFQARNNQLEQQIQKLKKQNETLLKTIQQIKSKGNSQANQIIAGQPPSRLQEELQKNKQIVFQTPLKESARKKDFVELEYNSVQGEIRTEIKNFEPLPDQHSKAHSQPQLKLESKAIFKSNKLIINEICQLLTYRMMAQRYTYSELQADIEKSPSKEFTYIDLCHMFVNQPFFLTVQYCRSLLCFMLEKERPSHNDSIASMALIAKLRKVIKDFQLPSEEEERKMIQNCANIITANSKQIKERCIINKQDKTISQSDLRKILLQISLSENEILMIIGQLSICSHDLAHLHLDVLFERFDLNEVQSESHRIIQQAQNDDSFIKKSKAKEENKQSKDDKVLPSQNILNRSNLKKNNEQLIQN